MNDTNDNASRRKQPLEGRRGFLRILGLGTVAAGTAVGLGNAPFVQAQEKDDDYPLHPDGPEYRETEHVRAFYATLRD